MSHESVDIFNQEQFQAALPAHKTTGDPLFTLIGERDGELTWLGDVDSRTQIEIRSSINATTGLSDGTGENSIRAWLVEKSTGKPLGSKVSRWTTRLPGWQDRLKDVLRTLWGWRLKAGDCPECISAKKIFKVKSKTSKNKGRVFAMCKACESLGKDKQWVWLDEVEGTKGFKASPEQVAVSDQREAEKREAAQPQQYNVEVSGGCRRKRRFFSGIW